MDGSSVDFLLMNYVGYNDYSSGRSFDYYYQYSSIYATSFSCDFYFSESTYLYLIIENTDVTPGGAPSTSTVDVSIFIGDELIPISDDYSSTIVVIVIICLVSGVVVIAYIRKMKAEKQIERISVQKPVSSPQRRAQYTHYQQQEGMVRRPSPQIAPEAVSNIRYCPTCGEKKNYEETYCSNCGAKI